jgi:phosphoesterase RecJ-like protein
MNKEVRVLNVSAVPDNLSFLNTDGCLVRYEQEVHREIVESADLIIMLDFNSPARVKSMQEALMLSHAVKVVVDHHLEPEPFADGYLIRTDACATGELIYDFIMSTMPGRLTGDVALGLYTAVMTDTGSFRFPNTTARTHQIAEHTIRLGVDPAMVNRRVFDDYPIGRALLLGRLLAGMEMLCDGRATLTSISRRQFEETGTTIDDTENLVNFGLSYRGPLITAMLTETEEGEVKISVRSRESVSSYNVAKHFGGGGHRLAAGATVSGTDIESIVEAVRAELQKAVAGAG